MDMSLDEEPSAAVVIHGLLHRGVQMTISGFWNELS